VAEGWLGALDPGDPAHAYGLAKRQAEDLVLGAQDMAPVVGRLFAFTGPHLALDRNYAAGNFMRDALRGGPLHIQGDGRPLRGYLYAADLVRAIWRLAARGRRGEIYQVGGPAAVSIRLLAEAVSRQFEPRPSILVAQPPGPAPAPSYVPEVSRLREELGFEPLVGLDEGLHRWAAWLGATHLKERAWAR
jgi:dTDP-glucose 4,6-dehydratase